MNYGLCRECFQQSFERVFRHIAFAGTILKFTIILFRTIAVTSQALARLIAYVFLKLTT